MRKKISVINRIRMWNIRNKIMAFYLTLVLFSILISVSLYFHMSNSYLDNTIYDLSISEVQSHNRNLELLLEDINGYSKEIVSSPSIQTALDPNQEQFYRLKQVDQELAASMMFDNKISSVYVFDYEAKKYYRDKQSFKNLQLEDIMAKEWYEDLVEKKGGYIFNFNGDGLIEDDKNDYLSFFRIINSNVSHQPVGVMMINIEDTALMDIFNINEDNQGSIQIKEMVYGTELMMKHVLVDDTDSELSQEIDQKIDEKMEGVFNDLLDKKVHFSEEIINRNDYYVTGFRNDAYQWGIAEVKVGRDRSSMISIFNLAILIIIVLNGVLIIYGSFVFSRYFTNPITELTKSMKAVEEGTFIPVKVETYHDEIGSLKEGYNYMIIEIQRLIEEVIKEQQAIKDAELRVILEQIKPHFMYNTLDSISSLVMLGRNDDANKALTALAKFYRSSLSDGRSVVTLSTELDIIRNYLLIQDIRYHDLFEVEYDVDEAVLDVKVPKLMLQPLVENCLYHGIRPMGMDGVIRVSARKCDDKVCIEVRDNGMGISDEDIEKVMKEAADTDGNVSSIGLPATIRRIKHMYDDRCEVVIDNDDSGTVFRIELNAAEGGVLS